MPKIFISYRREDSAGSAGRLFENLKRRFVGEQIFIDVTGIAIGQDFRKAIDEHVSACDVLLVVIGRNWVGARGSTSAPRLQDAKDFVRLEVVSALKREIPVVPVLVDGATMPKHEDLPEELESLGWRQAMELRHTRWDDDVDELMDSLEKITNKSGSPRPLSSPPLPGLQPSPPPRTPPLGLVSSPGVRVAPSRAAYLAVGGVLIGVIVAGLLYYSLRDGSVTATERVEQAKAVEVAKPDTPTDTRVAMPDFIGTDQRKAAVELQRSGFEVSRKARESSFEKPGVVVGQEPVPGTLLEEGARVMLVYAVEPSARMPKLVGLHVKEAMITAQKLGLVVDRRSAEATHAAPPFTVIRQDPAEDTPLKAGQAIRFVYATAPVASGTCIVGYVWREAFPGDRVCVTPKTRDEVRYDNSQADSRRAGFGPYGPNTCNQGYVWREANPKDLVCVTPRTRDLTRRDNAAAAERVQ